ncbi:hypothetical protein HMPREF9074_09036 [Capnocytophaga sp. oral taxon 329 str. F0087]|nr:hypothetical protein HMPREF9074_09036 [Capnocytophaga sp. oral taxon 329 str. F0087]
MGCTNKLDEKANFIDKKGGNILPHILRYASSRTSFKGGDVTLNSMLSLFQGAKLVQKLVLKKLILVNLFINFLRKSRV